MPEYNKHPPSSGCANACSALIVFWLALAIAIVFFLYWLWGAYV